MRIELKQNVSYIIAYRNVLLQKPIILLFNFICIFMSIVTVIAIAMLFFIMDFIPRHREPRVFFLSHSTNWLFITFFDGYFFFDFLFIISQNTFKFKWFFRRNIFFGLFMNWWQFDRDAVLNWQMKLTDHQHI